MQALTNVVIARLLQPELFGVYSLAFAFAAVLAILVGAGIQEAIGALVGSAYARGDRHGIVNVMAYMLKLTLWAALITVGILFLAPWISNIIYDSPVLGWYAGYIVAGVICSSLVFALASIVLQVSGKIKSFSILTMVDSSLRSGLSILFVVLGWSVLGAVTGQFIGALIVILFSLRSWRVAQMNDPLLPTLKEVWSGMKEVGLGTYFKFTAWVAADRNLASFFASLPVVIAGVYLSATEVTFFKLAFGYINLALVLLGPVSILLNFEFPRIHIISKERLAKSFTKVSLYSMGLSTVLTLAAIVVAPIAFQILYGSSFLPGAKYSVGLVLYGVFYGLGVGLGPMWRAINRVNVSLLINIITLAIGIPLGLVLVKYFGSWGAAGMVTLWFMASHIVSFLYLSRFLKTST